MSKQFVVEMVLCNVLIEPEWTEDDVFYEGWVSASSHWKSLFGKELNLKEALDKFDDGDCCWYLMPNGVVYCGSYRGNCGIYKVVKSDYTKKELLHACY